MINLQTIPIIAGIYKFTNKTNNKVYIGQALNLRSRITGHVYYYHKDYKENCYFYNAIKFHKIENFEVEILVEGCFSKQELNEMEITLIRLFKSNNPIYGYNLTAGGGGSSGVKLSQEHIEKLRQANLGRKLSNESKEKLRQANKGKIVSDETRKKQSESHKGYKPSLEIIEKRKLSNKNFKHSEESKEKMRGKIVSQETREKLSKVNTGYKHSEEAKEKNRQAHLGKNLGHEVSNETKQKISESQKGKFVSEETRKKLSEKGKGRKTSPEGTEKRIRSLKFNKAIKYFEKNNWIYEWVI